MIQDLNPFLRKRPESREQDEQREQPAEKALDGAFNQERHPHKPVARPHKFENFYFSFNGSSLNSVPFEKLDTLAEYLKKNPDSKIGVVGYTDAVGSASYNKTLSLKRANMVLNYLVKKGVKKEQLEAFGYGEENPYTLNMINGKYHEPSKKYNRRVEFFVIEQGKPKLKTILFKDIPDEYFNKDYNKDYKE